MARVYIGHLLLLLSARLTGRKTPLLQYTLALALQQLLRRLVLPLQVARFKSLHQVMPTHFLMVVGVDYSFIEVQRRSVLRLTLSLLTETKTFRTRFNSLILLLLEPTRILLNLTLLLATLSTEKLMAQ